MDIWGVEWTGTGGDWMCRMGGKGRSKWIPRIASTIPYNMVLQHILGLGYLEKEQVEQVGRL